MVGQELCLVAHPFPRHLLDPVRGQAVPARPVGPRDLRVRDVANQGVPERVLGLVLDRGGPHGADQFLPSQLVQSPSDFAFLTAGHGCHGPGPEHLAHHGRVLEQRLALRGKGVHACADEGLDGVRQLDVLGRLDQLQRPAPHLQRALIQQHPHELLRVERIAACLFEQCGLQFGGQDRLLQ